MNISAKNIISLIIFSSVVISSCTNNNSTRDLKIIEKLSLQADSLYNLDKLELALDKYDTLLILAPNFGKFHYRKGYCHSRKLELKEGNEAYYNAAELNFRPADAYYNIGVNLTLALNDSLAVVFFNKSLSINPNDSLAQHEIELATERMARIDSLMQPFRN